jgi:hypothetical protein
VAAVDNSVKVIYGFGPKGWPNHPLGATATPKSRLGVADATP